MIRIATWNVNFRASSVLSGLPLDRLDIATLQEVTLRRAAGFQDDLRAAGLSYVLYTGDEGATSKRYGNVIASRWPVHRTDTSNAASCFAWPQLITCVEVKTPWTPIRLVTAHIPNGSANGWAKIDAFKHLTQIVRSAKGLPCIVTGDFNEPQYAMQDDRVVTFGQSKGLDGRYTCWPKWRFNKREGTGGEWDSAVRWFFENTDEHGLRHAFWDVSGSGAMDETHTSRGNPRWFDHLFVSDHFTVTSCTYSHKPRLEGLSDHSSLIGDLDFRLLDGAGC